MALPITPFEIDDYLEIAKERSTTQFISQPVFERYLELLVTGQAELQLALKDMAQLRSIDNATGAQLDVIGNIVGQPRVVLSSYLGNGLEGFGELPDEAYRLFIKARIFKNVTLATPEDFLSMMAYVFDLDQVVLVEMGNANIRVDIAGEIGLFEYLILQRAKEDKNILPIPLGVGFEVAQFEQDEVFAFEGVEGGMGFADLQWDTTYRGLFPYDGSHDYSPERVLAVENVYSGRKLNGLRKLDGSGTLGDSVFVEQRVIGGFFSSLII